MVLPSKVSPLADSVPIVRIHDGTPTTYFVRQLQQLLDEKANTDQLAAGAVQDSDLTEILEALELDDLADVVLTTPAQGDILYRDTDLNGWKNLVHGTSGQLLQTNGANANPSWVTPTSGGGAYTLINSGGTTFSAATQVDIVLSTSYIAHKIVLYSTFSSDGANLNGQITTDNFSTIKSGASDYKYDSARGNTGALANTSSTGATAIRMATNVGSAAGDDMHGEVNIYFAADSGKLTKLTKNLIYGIGGGTNEGIEFGDGTYTTAATVNGIRLAPSAGNMTGKYYVYGLTGT